MTDYIQHQPSRYSQFYATPHRAVMLKILQPYMHAYLVEILKTGPKPLTPKRQDFICHNKALQVKVLVWPARIVTRASRLIFQIVVRKARL